MKYKAPKQSGTETFYFSSTEPHNRVVFKDFKSQQLAITSGTVMKNNFVQFLPVARQEEFLREYFNTRKSTSK